MLSTALHWVVVILRVAVLNSELLLAWIHIAKKFFKFLCFYQTTRTFFQHPQNECISVGHKDFLWDDSEIQTLRRPPNLP